MADLKDVDSNVTNGFAIGSKTFSRENTRIGVRYIREDIAVGVCKISLFSFGFSFNKEIVVDLLDISSKGLLIATDKKLRVNQEINIFLKFENNHVFRRKGKVARRAEGPPFRYGIQFDRLSNSLGDYLLDTQKKLIFR
jgi:PilZ domain